MRKKQPLISIITVNYNEPEVTIDLLNSLRKITYSNFEVFVVDNGSPTKNSDRIRDEFPEYNLIISKENLGFAGGNNLAVKEAIGEALLFINNDVEVPEDFLEPLVERLFSDKKIGMASPKIKFHHTPTHIQYAGSTQINPFTIRNKTIGYNEKDIGQYDDAKITNYAHGAGMLVKKLVIDKVGPMEDSFFLYYEEVDWCERIKKEGYTIWYEPKSSIYHKESVSTGKNSPLKTYYLTRNRLYYAKRNLSGTKYFFSAVFFYLIALPKNTLVFIKNGEYELMKSFYKGVMWNFSH